MLTLLINTASFLLCFVTYVILFMIIIHLLKAIEILTIDHYGMQFMSILKLDKPHFTYYEMFAVFDGLSGKKIEAKGIDWVFIHFCAWAATMFTFMKKAMNKNSDAVDLVILFPFFVMSI